MSLFQWFWGLGFEAKGLGAEDSWGPQCNVPGT